MMLCFDKKLTYLELKDKICSNCKMSCKSANFCVYLQNRLLDKFKYLFNYINRHHDGITKCTADDILPKLCNLCYARSHCYNDAECVRKLRIQLPSTDSSSTNDAFSYDSYDCCMDRHSYIQGKVFGRQQKTAAKVFCTSNLEPLF